jgi:hypothetical protein
VAITEQVPRVSGNRERHGMGISLRPAGAEARHEKRIDRLERTCRGLVKQPSATQCSNKSCPPQIDAEPGTERFRALDAARGMAGCGTQHRFSIAEIPFKDPQHATRARGIPGDDHLLRRAGEQRGNAVGGRAIGERRPERCSQEAGRRPLTGRSKNHAAVSQVTPDESPAGSPLPTPAPSLAAALGANRSQQAELALELTDVPVTGGPPKQRAMEVHHGNPSTRVDAIPVERLKEPPRDRRRQVDGAIPSQGGCIVRIGRHEISVAGKRLERCPRTCCNTPLSGSSIDWRWTIRPISSGNSA